MCHATYLEVHEDERFKVDLNKHIMQGLEVHALQTSTTITLPTS